MHNFFYATYLTSIETNISSVVKEHLTRIKYVGLQSAAYRKLSAVYCRIFLSCKKNIQFTTPPSQNYFADQTFLDKYFTNNNCLVTSIIGLESREKDYGITNINLFAYFIKMYWHFYLICLLLNNQDKNFLTNLQNFVANLPLLLSDISNIDLMLELHT